jgi:spore maturation protein CgeB
MRILYQIPSLNTIYAGRTIYFGYKHAFEDLGHKFKPLTADDNPEKILSEFKPDVLFTSLNSYNLRYLPIEAVRTYRKQGTKVFVIIPFWKSPMSKLRINETPSISEKDDYVKLIKQGNYGDVYFNNCEQGDPRMEGFEKATGYHPYTVLLAADKIINFFDYTEKYKADVSFIGTYLPDKARFLKEQVYPLRKKYDVNLYGQDWSYANRLRGFTQKVGQYFNISYVKSFQKPKLDLEDERKIYSSSTISINIHENYQRKFGGDCNERTFKIPLCEGFEITDDVACIRKYFMEGKEIIIAKDKNDWFDKIDYYIKNPKKRIPIIEAGRKRVLKEHTYHNRVNQLIAICKRIN